MEWNDRRPMKSADKIGR